MIGRNGRLVLIIALSALAAECGELPQLFVTDEQKLALAGLGPHKILPKALRDRVELLQRWCVELSLPTSGGSSIQDRCNRLMRSAETHPRTTEVGLRRLAVRLRELEATQPKGRGRFTEEADDSHGDDVLGQPYYNDAPPISRKLYSQIHEDLYPYGAPRRGENSESRNRILMEVLKKYDVTIVDYVKSRMFYESELRMFRDVLPERRRPRIQLK